MKTTAQEDREEKYSPIQSVQEKLRRHLNDQTILPQFVDLDALVISCAEEAGTGLLSLTCRRRNTIVYERFNTRPRKRRGLLKFSYAHFDFTRFLNYIFCMLIYLFI